MRHRTKRRCARLERLERRVLLASATLVKDIIPGIESSVSLEPSGFSRNCAALNGKLIFSALDVDHGQELWISDGTDTHLLKDVVQGDGSGNPIQFTVGGNYVFFTTSLGGGQQDEVWRTDGSEGGTIKVTNIPQGEGGPVSLFYAGGKLFFFTFNGSNSSLYKTDANGSQAKISGALTGGVPLADLNGLYLFRASDGSVDPAHGGELWSSDGNSASMVRDINPGQSGGNPGAGAVYKGNFYFDAFDPSAFTEVWKSNGTNNGTQLFANIRAGDSSLPTDFTVSGNYLFFIATAGSNAGDYQIYRSDGTAAGAVTALANTSSSIALRDLTDFNGTLFFTYSDAGGPRKLYKLVNGKTATLVGDGANGPGFLTVCGSSLFFSALDANSKARLYQTDGTTITQVGGDAGEDPRGLISVANTLFFQANDNLHGTELHGVGGDIITGPFTVKITNPDTINEGDTAILSVKVTPGDTAVKKVRWDLDGDGVYELSGSRVISHLFKDNTRIFTQPLGIGVEVTGKDGRIATDRSFIHIANVAPEVTLTVPAVTVVSAPTPYRIVVKDPGVDDDVTVDIDFGDKQKITGLKPGSNGVIVGVHTYTVASEFVGKDMKVQVRDKDGASKSKKKTVRAVPAALAEAAADTGLATGILRLIIGGDDKNNKIELFGSKKPLADKSKQRINVVIDGQLVNTFITGEQIQIWAGLGDDVITVASDIWVSVQAWGAGGKDTISGGSGDDTLNGESGSDNIRGNAGKDQIAGGTGNDNLGGGAQPDTVLGGSGNDKVSGNGGNDVLGGGPGNDSIDDLLGKNELLDELGP